MGASLLALAKSIYYSSNSILSRILLKESGKRRITYLI